MIHLEKFAGKNHCDFWKTAHILNVQQNGRSQLEIRDLFGSLLLEECGLDINQCGSDDGPYIYLDDVLFTGGRIGQDLTKWISGAPVNASIHIVVIAAHKLGEYLCIENLKRVAKDNKKIFLLLFGQLSDRKIGKSIKIVLMYCGLLSFQNMTWSPHTYPVTQNSLLNHGNLEYSRAIFFHLKRGASFLRHNFYWQG